MARILLIIDPQVDFITGSLPVSGAPDAMDALALHISQTHGLYDAIIITADWHPANHCSFSHAGGEWPVHCVAYSVGAAIWPSLYVAALSAPVPTEVLVKGCTQDREEYSIFRNAKAAEKIENLVSILKVTDIDICGLAGDICVLSSLKDGRERLPQCRFRVLIAYTPSIDGGTKLNDYIASNSVPCIR